MNARNSVAAILVAGLVATNLHLPAQINAPAKSVDERIEALSLALETLQRGDESSQRMIPGTTLISENITAETLAQFLHKVGHKIY